MSALIIIGNHGSLESHRESNIKNAKLLVKKQGWMLYEEIADITFTNTKTLQKLKEFLASDTLPKHVIYVGHGRSPDGIKNSGGAWILEDHSAIESHDVAHMISELNIKNACLGPVTFHMYMCHGHNWDTTDSRIADISNKRIWEWWVIPKYRFCTVDSRSVIYQEIYYRLFDLDPKNIIREYSTGSATSGHFCLAKDAMKESELKEDDWTKLML